MTSNTIHRGEIVDKIVRKSGHSLTKLAEKLGITRNTLYNKFERADLDYRFIVRVGSIIYYDFSREFPEMKEERSLMDMPSSFVERQEASLWRAQAKYTKLLEKYSKLLAILTRAVNDNELPSLSREISQLIED